MVVAVAAVLSSLALAAVTFGILNGDNKTNSLLRVQEEKDVYCK
jgi:hypothetical protein